MNLLWFAHGIFVELNGQISLREGQKTRINHQGVWLDMSCIRAMRSQFSCQMCVFGEALPLLSWTSRSVCFEHCAESGDDMNRGH